MITTFETSSELANYVKIECDFYIDTNNKRYTKKEIENEIKQYGCLSENIYPAPSLEELLRVSPVSISVGYSEEFEQCFITYGERKQEIWLDKSDNLTEQVAQIILQYYRSKENG